MNVPLLACRITAGYAGREPALRELSLEIDAGAVVGLVGQSGSGKSTLALALLRLLDVKGGSVAGEVRFAGRDLLALSGREMRRVRGREIALVPQSPLAALNPALTVGTQLREAWRVHAGGRPGESFWLEALRRVALPAEAAFLRRYPRQLSVGQAQRVVIAMGILHRPRLLIADEPTSALDAITQREILELFADLNRRLGMAILYVSHDLLSVASLCHRIAILHEGRIVESGPATSVLDRPSDPYARRLVAALPRAAWNGGRDVDGRAAAPVGGVAYH